jgi:hypothetical protein
MSNPSAGTAMRRRYAQTCSTSSCVDAYTTLPCRDKQFSAKHGCAWYYMSISGMLWTGARFGPAQQRMNQGGGLAWGSCRGLRPLPPLWHALTPSRLETGSLPLPLHSERASGGTACPAGCLTPCCTAPAALLLGFIWLKELGSLRLRIMGCPICCMVVAVACTKLLSPRSGGGLLAGPRPRASSLASVLMGQLWACGAVS